MAEEKRTLMRFSSEDKAAAAKRHVLGGEAVPALGFLLNTGTADVHNGGMAGRGNELFELRQQAQYWGTMHAGRAKGVCLEAQSRTA